MFWKYNEGRVRTKKNKKFSGVFLRSEESWEGDRTHKMSSANGNTKGKGLMICSILNPCTLQIRLFFYTIFTSQFIQKLSLFEQRLNNNKRVSIKISSYITKQNDDKNCVSSSMNLFKFSSRISNCLTSINFSFKFVNIFKTEKN